jgi:prevent-host-death family protein
MISSPAIFPTTDNPYISDRMFLTLGAIMAQTTAVEFQRKIGEFQHRALREPVKITRHGRRELVLLSAEYYDWLVAAARRTHRTQDVASVVAEAVERSEMGPEHSHLDELVE